VVVSKYKAEWKPSEANYSFWTEVLVGKRITSLGWADGRLTDLELDDGQKVSIVTNENGVATLAIKD
jgi:hypothetical protein